MWDDASQAFMRGIALPMDSGYGYNYTGSQNQLIHGRYENGQWCVQCDPLGRSTRIGLAWVTLDQAGEIMTHTLTK